MNAAPPPGGSVCPRARSARASVARRACVLAGALLWATGCWMPRPPETITPEEAAAERAAIEAELPKPREVAPGPAVTERVAIRTDRGTIVVGLFGEDAPETVASFLEYVDEGFYEGLIFHRVIPAFMIQAGGFDEELERALTRGAIELEVIPGVRHEPGTVSMARISSDPHSATSQFFICVAKAPQLNGGYSVFGAVEEGYDLVVEISNTPTHSIETDHGSLEDVPVTPIVIESIERLPPR